MVRDLELWERPDPPVFDFDRSLIPLFSPRSKSIPEVRTQRDLDICRKIYEHSIRIGDKVPGWEIEYAREFDMTNDSRLFKPRDWWEARGYKPDVYGRWIGPDADVALPLYEGRMIGQFDFSEKGWVSGRGRSANWPAIPMERKQIKPQFLLAQETYLGWGKGVEGPKLAMMDITSATNSRTQVSSVIRGFGCGHSIGVLALASGDLSGTLALSAYMNSFCFDFALRARHGGLHMSWFLVEECPIPEADKGLDRAVAECAARLIFIHRRFAPEWLRLKDLYPELGTREWKHWWAVTEADRLRLRVEIDALCADLYGLNPDDFDRIVRDDPSDPKGFWRVDKQLPYEQRLTGLASRAFRALKSGLWSVASDRNEETGHRPPATNHRPPPTGHLTNDEFFDLLGIPELTSEAAAKAKGHDRPLIYERDGCHRWRPEEFSEDDPRYGWTWDHCYQDAVALLGSEQAVEDYIENQGRGRNETHEGGARRTEGQEELF